MTSLDKVALAVSVSFLMVFFSCSARIDGVVREGGAADLSLTTSLEPRTTSLIRSLQGFMGDTSDAPVLDGATIGQSMAAAPGIRSVSLGNTGPAALAGAISISNVGDFLTAEDAKNRFITYNEGPGPGTSSIIISLDKDSAPELISLLSPDVEDYLSALMAPAVTGETSSAREYLDLVALVYGRPLADEIAAARIRATIEFPRPVTAVKGGAASGKKAEFEIPLTDLLVLEQPLLYEIYW